MRGSSPVWKTLARSVQASLADQPFSLSRRSVLASLAAGAAMSLTGCGALRSGGKGGTVVIIGGGLAGLNALRLLTEAGIDAQLYEGRARLGGRVFTARGGPVPADSGGQFINSDHADMLDLAKRLGLKLIDRKAFGGRSLVFDPGKSNRGTYDQGRSVDDDALAAALAPLAAMIARDAAALEAQPDAALARIDALSVSQYLDAAALPQGQARSLIEMTIRTEFGQEPDEASAMELIWNLPAVPEGQPEVISSSDERFVLEGGSGTLIDALAAPLMERIHTGRALKSVKAEGKGVRLHFASGEDVTADHVLITVPAPLLRTIDFFGLLPPVWQAYAAEIGCGRNEKLNAAYWGRPWEKVWGRGGEMFTLSGGCAEIWDAGTTTSQTGLLTYFMGGQQCSDAPLDDLGKLRFQLQPVAVSAVPELEKAALPWQKRTAWSDDPFARGAYSCFKPGQLTRFSGLFWLEQAGKAQGRSGHVPAFGPLIFAGEHLSDAWPGYMNGALQTGRLAAAELIRAQA